MSEKLVFIKNKSRTCSFGLLAGQVPLFPQQEVHMFGTHVHIAAGATVPDPNGAMWESMKHDSDAWFVNCDDSDEAVALKVPRSKFGWWCADEGKLYRGERPGAPSLDKPAPDVVFKGFWGVLHCLVDDSANSAEIMRHMHTLSGGVAYVKELEAKLAASTNRVNEMVSQMADRDAEILKLRGQLMLARGPSAPDAPAVTETPPPPVINQIQQPRQQGARR